MTFVTPVESLVAEFVRSMEHASWNGFITSMWPASIREFLSGMHISCLRGTARSLGVDLQAHHLLIASPE